MPKAVLVVDGRKKCGSCKELLAVEEFAANPRTASGLSSWCGKCWRRRSGENREANRPLLLAKDHQRRVKNPHRYWSRQTMANHRKRGFTFLFSLEELQAVAEKATLCPLCGVELCWDYTVKGLRKRNAPSLDRVWNDQRALALRDVAILCWRCNTTKGDRTLPEFLAYCRKVLGL